MVRVKVLGLAGIHVDRAKSRNRDKRKEFPRPPGKMRAVVAVSRGQHIKATTNLSKPLSRSPDDGSSKSQSKGRHLAVWTTEDESSLGSVMTFQANLHRLDIGDSHESSSQFVPMSFNLTVALTEDTDHEKKVALPIGIANLNVSGDSSDAQILDLPVLNLKQAKPTESDNNGLGGFQMISIHEKGLNSKGKKNSLGRLLGRNGNAKQQKIPPVVDRRLFSTVYSADAKGDSILRVQIQVIEKTALIHHKDVIIQNPHPQISENNEGLELSNRSEDSLSEESLDVTKDSRDTTPTQCSGSQETGFSGCDDSIEGNLSKRSVRFWEDETGGVNTFSVFGREIRLPQCGQVVDGDDMTHITGEMFGREFPIPVCSAVRDNCKFQDFESQTDEDSRTTQTTEHETGGRKDALKGHFVNRTGSKGSVQSAAENGQEAGDIRILFEKALEEAHTDLKKDDLGAHRGGALDNKIDTEKVSRKEKPENNEMKKTGKSSRPSTLHESHLSVTESIVNAFRCTGKSTVDENICTYRSGSKKSGVPSNLAIPRDSTNIEDDMTALTVQEFRLGKGRRENCPLPIALGGSGMCTNMHLDTHSQHNHEMKRNETKMKRGSPSSSSKRSLRNERDYFEEYDNVSLERPRTQESARSGRRFLT